MVFFLCIEPHTQEAVALAATTLVTAGIACGYIQRVSLCIEPHGRVSLQVRRRASYVCSNV